MFQQFRRIATSYLHLSSELIITRDVFIYDLSNGTVRSSEYAINKKILENCNVFIYVLFKG
jgi:hypothetical protein